MAAIDRDLTTGPIAGHFRALAIPAAIGMLFSTLYNVVDVFFAGLISTDAQAGLAIGFQAFFINMAVGFGLGSALGALVGAAKGRKDATEARVLAVQGIGFGVVASGVMMITAVWVGPALIALVSEPGAYRDAGTGYFTWLIWSLPGFLLAYGGNGILQARGDTRSLQRALVVAFFANVVLNPLLIYGIPGVIGGMGFNGIAASTIIAQTGVGIYVLRQIFAREMMQGFRWHEFRPDLAIWRRILGQMLPTGLSMMVVFAAGFVMQFFLKDFGGQAVAGYGVALRVEQMLLLPMLGVTGSLLPIAAQNFGAGDFARVREAVWFCWRLGLVLMVLSCPILWFGGHWAVGLFTDDAEVIAIGASYLRVEGFILPFYMMLFATNSLLQALQRPIWTLAIGIYRQAFAVTFFVWVFVKLWGFDHHGVWYGVAVAVISGWVLSLIVAEMVARRVMGGLWTRSDMQKAPA